MRAIINSIGAFTALLVLLTLFVRDNVVKIISNIVLLIVSLLALVLYPIAKGNMRAKAEKLGEKEDQKDSKMYYFVLGIIALLITESLIGIAEILNAYSSFGPFKVSMNSRTNYY